MKTNPYILSIYQHRCVRCYCVEYWMGKWLAMHGLKSLLKKQLTRYHSMNVSKISREKKRAWKYELSMRRKDVSLLQCIVCRVVNNTEGAGGQLPSSLFLVNPIPTTGDGGRLCPSRTTHSPHPTRIFIPSYGPTLWGPRWRTALWKMLRGVS